MMFYVLYKYIMTIVINIDYILITYYSASIYKVI